MEIGLIVSDRAFVSPELKDLQDAIKETGHKPLNIEIENVAVKIKSGKTVPYHMSTQMSDAPIKADCAVLRNIGFIKDYEQFSQRIWAIK